MQEKGKGYLKDYIINIPDLQMYGVKSETTTILMTRPAMIRVTQDGNRDFLRVKPLYAESSLILIAGSYTWLSEVTPFLTGETYHLKIVLLEEKMMMKKLIWHLKSHGLKLP